MAAKIIATYGPQLKETAVMEEVLRHADMMRVNFSHLSEEERLAALAAIKSASKSQHKSVDLLADLPGPKMRVSMLKRPIYAASGTELSLVYYKDLNGHADALPIDADIYDDISAGSFVSIGDGVPKLKVLGKEGRYIKCSVLYGGNITNRKGINIQGSLMSAEPPTREDISMAGFAVRNNFGYIALSFVKAGSNITEARRYCGSSKIVAKIERPEAITNIDEITEKSDAVMIARGDLALNIGLAALPRAQRLIIDTAKRHNKPVIVATQLLSSMINSPVPTRAEINDIAHSVEQGADYLMLSDETAVGKYPAEAVAMLYEIANYA